METSRCATRLLCFHSSNRPCVIPKWVSGSSIGKIFRALFQGTRTQWFDDLVSLVENSIWAMADDADIPPHL